MERVPLLARNGSLKIFDANERSFFFKHIDFKSAVSSGGVDFQLTGGESSLWQTLEFKGMVDPGALMGSAVLHVTGGNPKNLARCLGASAENSVGGSLADISAALSYTGPGKFRADFTASAPSFTFGINQRSMTIKEGFLAGILLTDTKGIELSISDFHCAFSSSLPHRELLGKVLGRNLSDYRRQ